MTATPATARLSASHRADPTTSTGSSRAFGAAMARRTANWHARRRVKRAPAYLAALERVRASAPDDAAAIEAYVTAVNAEAATWRIALKQAAAAAGA